MHHISYTHYIYIISLIALSLVTRPHSDVKVGCILTTRVIRATSARLLHSWDANLTWGRYNYPLELYFIGNSAQHHKNQVKKHWFWFLESAWNSFYKEIIIHIHRYTQV